MTHHTSGRRDRHPRLAWGGNRRPPLLGATSHPLQRGAGAGGGRAFPRRAAGLSDPALVGHALRTVSARGARERLLLRGVPRGPVRAALGLPHRVDPLALGTPPLAGTMARW